MGQKKKPNNKDPEKPGRTKQKSTGKGESAKSRPQVPSTNANKAATGKIRTGKRVT